MATFRSLFDRSIRRHGLAAGSIWVGLNVLPTTHLKASTTTNNNTKDFYGQCLERQLHHPNVPYPAWDYNWDGRMTTKSSLPAVSTLEGLRRSKIGGKTRHLLLIRHGQYDETYDEDERRHLTELGQKQAQLTGERLAKLQQVGVPLRRLHVSDMTRAKETAAIIAEQLSADVERMSPDPLLNEALPSPMIPVRPDVPNAVVEIDANHDRIEEAFRKYFYRSTDKPSSDDDRHEFEVIVGHGNVIRYFTCRALQLPPEAWLRMSVFNCSLTYIQIQPNGYVSVRLLGDTGHLGYEDTSFSGNHGYVW